MKVRKRSLKSKCFKYKSTSIAKENARNIRTFNKLAAK